MAASSARLLSLRRLFGLVVPHRTVFGWGMVALVAGSGINLLFPEVVRRALDEQYRTTLVDQPATVAGIFLFLLAAQGLSFYFRSLLFGIVGQRVVADLRRRIMSALLRQEVAFFDSVRTGDLVSRMSADTQMMQMAASTTLSVLIRYTAQVVVGIGLMLWLSPTLSVVLLLTLPVLLLVGKILGARLKKASKAQQEALGLSTTIVEEAVSGIRMVKAFSYEPTLQTRYALATEEVVARGIDRARIAAGFSSFANFLMNVAIVIVLFYGIAQVGRGEMNLPDLAAFLLYGMIVGVSFTFLSGAYTELAQAGGAAERIFDVIDREPQVVEPEIPRPLRGKDKIALEFDQVSFAYPVRPDREVLREISFQIPPGKVVALVGPSGSGKSTIVSLALRWYDPTSGVVRMNGDDVRTLDLAEACSVMALVPQDAHVFAASIFDNVRVGAPGATEDAVMKALEAASLGDVVRGLPKGIYTEIGERGVQLSGGQRQRLAIARAIVRNPHLLILDEATSALDSESEFAVQQALNGLMRNRSTLVIAHRLSTVTHADEILVLDRGVIVQRGGHRELMAQPGLYRTLVERQDLIPEEAHERAHPYS